MSIINSLKEMKNSEKLSNRPLLKRLVSLIVDYDTETYEIFNYGLLLFWGLWVLNPNAIFVSPAVKVMKFITPISILGFISIILATFGFFVLSKYIDESRGITLRKNCMFSSSMFFSFLFFMNAIYIPTYTGIPIYFCLTMFGFWQCLRLKSLEWDLKNGNR